MHKPFDTWTNFFRKLGLKPKRSRKCGYLKHRALRHEPLVPRCMLAADIAVTGFYGDGNDLVVSYDVVGDDAAQFDVDIYRSDDGLVPGELLASRTVTSRRDLKEGGHTLRIRATFDDVIDDYQLIAKTESRSTGWESFIGPKEAPKWRSFDGGVFVAGDGTVQVHGSRLDDEVVIWVEDSGTLGVKLNDRGRFSYDSRQVSGIHLRTHGGDDTVQTGPNVAIPLVVFAGEGDDVIRGGIGDDILVGGPGNDRLYGSKGSDVLVGGAGEDELWGGPGDDVLNGGDGNNTLIAGAGDDTVFEGKGQEHLDRNSATSIFKPVGVNGLEDTLLVAGGQSLAQDYSVATIEADGGSLIDSVGPAGFGVAADHLGGGSVLKRELPVSGGSFEINGFQPTAAAGAAVDRHRQCHLFREYRVPVDLQRQRHVCGVGERKFLRRPVEYQRHGHRKRHGRNVR